MIYFQPIKLSEVQEVKPLAKKIWLTTYLDIITMEQIEFMLEKMYSPNIISTEISKGYHWNWVIKDALKIGYFSFYYQDKRCYLSKIYLLQDTRGLKIGDKIIQFIMEQMKENKVNELQLTVNKKNPAIHFYERIGFVREREIITDIGNGFVMDDYIYILIILN